MAKSKKRKLSPAAWRYYLKMMQQGYTEEKANAAALHWQAAMGWPRPPMEQKRA